VGEVEARSEEYGLESSISWILSHEGGFVEREVLKGDKE